MAYKVTFERVDSLHLANTTNTKKADVKENNAPAKTTNKGGKNG